ncbi:MAG TPA: gas vesicle protein K [Candidatus Limnocylindria bacterium]
MRAELARVSAQLPERIDVDPDDVERGLAGLVLGLVELLRQVLEKQAVRRMEGGSLTDEEIERVGLALMRLERKVRELAEHFGLTEDDLRLGLGAS